MGTRPLSINLNQYFLIDRRLPSTSQPHSLARPRCAARTLRLTHIPPPPLSKIGRTQASQIARPNQVVSLACRHLRSGITTKYDPTIFCCSHFHWYVTDLFPPHHILLLLSVPESGPSGICFKLNFISTVRAGIHLKFVHSQHLIIDQARFIRDLTSARNRYVLHKAAKQLSPAGTQSFSLLPFPCIHLIASRPSLSLPL